jgi:hypothetical protein
MTRALQASAATFEAELEAVTATGGSAAESCVALGGAAAVVVVAEAAASAAAGATESDDFFSAEEGFRMRLAREPSGAWSGCNVDLTAFEALSTSSELTSDSICARNSFDARRNSLRIRATWRTISGIFLGPKRISARRKMKIISPEKPKFIISYHNAGERVRPVIELSKLILGIVKTDSRNCQKRYSRGDSDDRENGLAGQRRSCQRRSLLAAYLNNLLGLFGLGFFGL